MGVREAGRARDHRGATRCDSWIDARPGARCFAGRGRSPAASYRETATCLRRPMGSGIAAAGVLIPSPRMTNGVKENLEAPDAIRMRLHSTMHLTALEIHRFPEAVAIRVFPPAESPASVRRGRRLSFDR